MSADKKISRKDLPRPEEKDIRHESQEEYDVKPTESKNGRDNRDSDRKVNMKKRGVNYVIKDLPIY